MELDDSLFSSGKIDRVYAALVNEEDARVCQDISDDSCQVVSGNFLLLAVAGGLWLLAAGIYALIREYPGATEGSHCRRHPDPGHHGTGRLGPERPPARGGLNAGTPR
jgi:hypothetical protein